MTMTEDATTEAIYREHGDYLWGVAYRMLGVGADADEVLQDAFVRFLGARPDLGREIRPWLVRVTVNLARDRLRARTKAGYVGTWLPAVFDVDSLGDPSCCGANGARYGALESLSLSFLWAAEQLDDTQRAVLVLRDVFGYSVRETAEMLELSESNVKVIGHRVRARMKHWEQTQRRRLSVPHEQVVDAMRRFFLAVSAGDRSTAESLLRDDVRMLSDGGGEFFSARAPVVGAAKVAGLYLKLATLEASPRSVEIRTLGGRPTLVVRATDSASPHAPVVCLQLELDPDGKVAEIHALLAPAKVDAMLSRPTRRAGRL